MIMVNYADLWLVHSRVASLLDGAILELRELRSYSTLLGVYGVPDGVPPLAAAVGSSPTSAPAPAGST